MLDGFLRYENHRYLRWSAALLAACIALYLSQSGIQPPNGGTWQGYVLGTIGALLIVWLTMLGRRKRKYQSRLGTVQGWVSAHIYLGISLFVIATLHTGFQLGINVHTLAYLLMCIVIASGLWGTYMYLRCPTQLTINRNNANMSELLIELSQLNESTKSLAELCDPEVGQVVVSAVDRTVLGGGVIDQLFARDKSLVGMTSEKSKTNVIKANLDQRLVISFIGERIPRCTNKDESVRLQTLLSQLARRQSLLRTIRKDVSLQGWLRMWLYIHIPLTFTLLVSLVIHIVTVFIYW